MVLHQPLLTPISKSYAVKCLLTTVTRTVTFLRGMHSRQATTMRSSTNPKRVSAADVHELELMGMQYQYASRDHILFCIDASPSMQTPYPYRETPDGSIKGKSALHQVIDAVAEIERRKVITGPADSVGVLLYNIDVSVYHLRC